MTDIRIVETIEEVRSEICNLPRPLGLVPTMGSLHAGHLALVQHASSENESVVVTIFVNPTQFGQNEDYETYPRDVGADVAALGSENVDLVFAPSVSEMYPSGFDSYVYIGKLTEYLEGEERPLHFRGVATIVCKLLAIVRPDRAYFGQKDAQQSLIVKRLNTDLNLGADIIIVPTVRDGDGVAVSSRNHYLSEEERQAAVVLYRSLRLAQTMKGLGVRDGGQIKQQMREMIEKEPLVQMNYISIADPETLEQIDTVSRSALVLIGARVGNVRLIDNMRL